MTTKRRVLLLMGLDDNRTVTITRLSPDPRRLGYECLGNVELSGLLDRDRFDVVTYLTGPVPSEPLRLPNLHVVVNAICDADTNRRSLEIAAGIVDRLPGVRVVNHPKAVLATTRDAVSERLAGIDGAVVPRTARITPAAAAEVPALAAAGGVEPPFLVREAGTHGGHQLVVVRDPGELADLERFAFDGRAFYATEFVDFRSADGLYRKYRALVVGGEPHAKHLIVAPEWNVHARSRPFMAERPELEEEEARFVAGMPEPLRPVFAAVHERLGLDYLGADFGVLDDGRVVFFEVNCCFRPLVGTAGESAIASHAESTERLKRAFSHLVAGGAAPPP